LSIGDAGVPVRATEDGVVFDGELAEVQSKILEQQKSHFQRNRARGRVHTAAHHREQMLGQEAGSLINNRTLRQDKNSHSNYGLIYNHLRPGDDGALVKAPQQFETLPQPVQVGVAAIERVSRAIGRQTPAHEISRNMNGHIRENIRDDEPPILNIPIKTSMSWHNNPNAVTTNDKARTSHMSKKVSLPASGQSSRGQSNR